MILAETLDAVVTVGLIILSIGLQMLSAHLLKKKRQSGTPDAPATLSRRGSFVSRVIGRRKVAAVFGWAGTRVEVTERTGGSSGGVLGFGKRRNHQRVFFEEGWHQLAVGPGNVLHEIEQAGEVLFQGPINPVSHPSGSFLSIGGEGGFFIFWGEVDQPVNTFLGVDNKVEVNSRWPHLMYIVWASKRLGTQAVWPQLNYDIEVPPFVNHLSDTVAAMPGEFFLEGINYQLLHPVLDVIVNGVEGVGLLQFRLPVRTNPQPPFFNGGRFRLTGNGNLPDQDFDIYRVEHTLDFIQVNRTTTIYPIGGISGASLDGLVQSYTLTGDGGINAAHIEAELWFSPWPHGINQSKTLFDMPSLEALGTLIVTENLRSSIIAAEGQDLRSVFASMHQDLGVFLPYNFLTGKLQFVSVREPVLPLANITTDAQIKITETTILHGPKKTDRVVFSFPDQQNRFREQTIGINNAGHVARQEFFRTRTVQLESTVVFETAATIAERRSQEEVTAVTHKLSANRAARLLLPGTQITADGIAEILLVTSVETDPLSGIVIVDCIPSFLGAKESAFVADPGTTPPAQQVAISDLMTAVMEVPEWLSGSFQMVLGLRVRAHDQIDGAFIHLSLDDSVFVSVAEDFSLMQGGILIDPIAIGDDYEMDVGPTITAVGPDIATVLDLSADVLNWRKGRQLVFIDDELFFLKNVDSLGGDVYRLRGLIRARYDTRPAAHAADASVFIFQNDDGESIDDVLLAPQITMYLKSQAFGNGISSLALASSDSVALYGKGIRPVPVSDIRFNTLTDPAGVSTHSWVGAGSTDLDITWGYFTPQSTASGAGFSGAGTPQFAAPPEGDFLVEILDSGNNIIRTITRTTNNYIYTETNRLADFSAAEPATFKVRVTQLRAGLLADTVTQTFTRI